MNGLDELKGERVGGKGCGEEEGKDEEEEDENEGDKVADGKERSRGSGSSSDPVHAFLSFTLGLSASLLTLSLSRDTSFCSHDRMETVHKMERNEPCIEHQYIHITFRKLYTR